MIVLPFIRSSLWCFPAFCCILLRIAFVRSTVFDGDNSLSLLILCLVTGLDIWVFASERGNECVFSSPFYPFIQANDSIAYWQQQQQLELAGCVVAMVNIWLLITIRKSAHLIHKEKLSLLS